MSEQSIKAGADGTASWSPPAHGRYAVAVSETIPRPGTLDGKGYDEIREFASLSFAWPLEGRAADGSADAPLCRCRRPSRHLAGLRGVLRRCLRLVRRPRVRRQGHGQGRRGGANRDREPGAKTWLQDQLDSMVMHRRPQTAATSGEKTPQFRFVEDSEGHPSGRLMTVEGGQMASSYRIKDHQIMVVNRRMGKQNMTITYWRTRPTRMAGSCRTATSSSTGTPQAASSCPPRRSRSAWQRVGSLDLPVLHSVATAPSRVFHSASSGSPGSRSRVVEGPGKNHEAREFPLDTTDLGPCLADSGPEGRRKAGWGHAAGNGASFP